MSWMFTRWQSDLVNVRSTLLDDAADHRPFLESCIEERLPWARTGAVHSFEGFPPPERYPALMAEFAAWRATPPS
jgi:hypothetical protein